MSDNAELIARLEAAEGGSRELDEAVLKAVGWYDEDAPQQFGPRAIDSHVTTSIDCALALVGRKLPGWTVAHISQQDDKRWWAELRQGYLTSYSRVAMSERHPTPALALLIALLRATDTAERHSQAEHAASLGSEQ